tara:strand:- start:7989 stop:8138 length:150 start_codon:yes stop_codon:yes gene_type:complete
MKECEKLDIRNIIEVKELEVLLLSCPKKYRDLFNSIIIIVNKHLEDKKV